MKDEQRVYIKGDSERGDEVIKILEGLGGNNPECHTGNLEEALYYINPRGTIVCVFEYDYSEYSLVKEFYKEIKLPKWKPKNNECYYRITWIGEVAEAIWYGLWNDESGYKFGNCFRTQKEAELAKDKIKEILNKHK